MYLSVLCWGKWKTLDIPEWIGYVPDSQPYHLIITSASGSWSNKLTKLQISCIETIRVVFQKSSQGFFSLFQSHSVSHIHRSTLIVHLLFCCRVAALDSYDGDNDGQGSDLPITPGGDSIQDPGSVPASDIMSPPSIGLSRPPSVKRQKTK